MRKSDRFVLVCIVLLAGQLLVGAIAANAQRRSGSDETQAVMNAELALKADGLNMRVDALEQLHLDRRLAVIENGLSEIKEIRRLAYSLFFTTLGSLLLKGYELREARNRRGRQ